MTEDETKQYIDLFHKMFDNLLYMGMVVKMDGLVSVKQLGGKGVKSEVIARNKVYVKSLVSGEQRNRYICRKYTEKGALKK